MKKLIHSVEIRQKLRTWRPLYNRIFRRTRDLSRMPSPEAYITSMNRRGILMFSYGRCGTRVFADLMSTHPQILTLGEVLNEDSYYSFFQDFSHRTLRWWALRPSLMERCFYEYMARMVRRNPGVNCLFDLKIEGLHLVDGNWRTPDYHFRIFDAALKSDAPVILVQRNDLVGRHLSGQIAAARQAYHSYHDVSRPVDPFTIDIARMEQRNAVIRDSLAYIKQRFADHPRFEVVTYEEMFETDPETGRNRFRRELAARMARLLDVPEDGFDLEPKLDKMVDGGAKKLVLNIDEVEAARARQPALQPSSGY